VAVGIHDVVASVALGYVLIENESSFNLISRDASAGPDFRSYSNLKQRLHMANQSLHHLLVLQWAVL